MYAALSLVHVPLARSCQPVPHSRARAREAITAVTSRASVPLLQRFLDTKMGLIPINTDREKHQSMVTAAQRDAGGDVEDLEHRFQMVTGPGAVAPVARRLRCWLLVPVHLGDAPTSAPILRSHRSGDDFILPAPLRPRSVTMPSPPILPA